MVSIFILTKKIKIPNISSINLSDTMEIPKTAGYNKSRDVASHQIPAYNN